MPDAINGKQVKELVENSNMNWRARYAVTVALCVLSDAIDENRQDIQEKYGTHLFDILDEVK